MLRGYTIDDTYSKPPVGRIDPFDRNSPESYRDKVTAWALAAGIDLLEEDDVINKGGYVVPRTLVPGTRYVTNEDIFDISQLHASNSWSAATLYGFSSVARFVWYVGPLPLRVEGMFSNGDGEVIRYTTSVARGSQDMCRVLDDGRSEPLDTHFVVREAHIYSNHVPVDWLDLPVESRRGLRRSLLTLRAYTNATLVDNLRANNRAVVVRDREQAKYKGIIYSNRVVLRNHKNTCRDFAEIIKAAVSGDSYTYDDACIKINNTNVRLGDHLIDVWNSVTDDEYQLMRGACEHVFRCDDGNDTAHGRVCEDCFEDYRLCDDDGEYRHLDECYYHESDGEFRSYPPDDEDDDADDHDDHDRSGLLCSWGASCAHLAHDKSFTPSSNGDFTMGIELEVQATDSRSQALRDCNDHFNRDVPYAMFKRDGSLSDDYGFEIVTAARRLNDHLVKFKEWEPNDLESWDPGCCGMHVHIDSRAFTALSLGKFLMFYNQDINKDFIRDIAGRHPSTDGGAKSYAGCIHDSRTVSPVAVKRASENESRYTMVNVTNLTQYEQHRLGVSVSRDSKGNYSTVEVRIFRGTLRKARLLAQIEFTHASVIFCRTASWQELDGDAFKFWLSKTAGYPNLRKWFGVFPSRNKKLTDAASADQTAVEI